MNYLLNILLQASVLTDLRMEDEESEPFGFFDLIKFILFVYIFLLIIKFLSDDKKN